MKTIYFQEHLLSVLVFLLLKKVSPKNIFQYFLYHKSFLFFHQLGISVTSMNNRHNPIKQTKTLQIYYHDLEGFLILLPKLYNCSFFSGNDCFYFFQIFFKQICDFFRGFSFFVHGQNVLTNPFQSASFFSDGDSLDNS